MNVKGPKICKRLAQIRLMQFGRRGKARFAAALGIRPSRYNLYEVNRPAPAEILVRAARITGTSLIWLLTGEGEIEAPVDVLEPTKTDPLLRRAQHLLQKRPELRRSLQGYVELLEEIAAGFPEKATLTHSISDLIPVVGGTAAGPARFWSEFDQTHGGPEADSRLEHVLGEYAERAVQRANLRDADPPAKQRPDVALVQLSRPDELGLLEFISCPAVKSAHPSAIAWRLDGDSMAPRYADGDLVITSHEEQAIEGRPCVARQENQIGVNCKIFQRTGGEVVLIPLNEAYAPQRFPIDKLLWAYRVLYSVRVSSAKRPS